MTDLTNSDLQSMSFTIEGDVDVQVTITELSTGDLQFDVSVLDDTGSIGDLQGLFFDLVDPSILDGLVVSGTDITADEFDEGDVDNLGGGVNIKGELTQDEGFDAGIRFGTSGISKDDIQETSFTLSHDDLDLMVDDFFGVDFGVRLTSVGEEDGTRDDSLKLGGTAPTAPEDDEPDQPPMDDEPDQPPMDEEPEQPPMDEEPEQPPMDEEPEQPPMDEEPEQPPMDEEPEQPPMDEEPEQPPMDEEPEQPPMDEEPEQPPMDEEPEQPPMDEEPASGLIVPDDPMAALTTDVVYDEVLVYDFEEDETTFEADLF